MVALSLFNCKVTDIRHGDDGVTVVTEEGEYHGNKLLVSAGTWVTKLLPDLPVKSVRKIFAWHQADGRYSENNKFRRLPQKHRTAINIMASRREDNELKLGQA
ncbi:N-methyl-L-tryptophan oxidase [Cedecea neteri]|uniref:N-methyl-L-tryptophan oxidase n=1 Tax=Cedecea neteri TaxID=158822 RepID=A0A2X3JDF9_9ENTR|nr:N-methyl-L-tryptophan oxidase [Cedecea neteri]